MRRSIVVLVCALSFALAPSAQAGGGGFCRGALATDASGTVVAMEDSCFTPTVLRVGPGEAVTWINRDPFPHVVAGANVAWGSYRDLNHGDATTETFQEPGVYPYYCFLHVGMIGAVVVGDGIPPGTAREADVVPPPWSAGSEATSVEPNATGSRVASSGPGAWLWVGASGALLVLGAVAVSLRSRGGATRKRART